MLRWLWVSLALASAPMAEAGDGVVRALLFVSPTCPHCHKVLEVVLPPLIQRFGGRLEVGVINTSTPAGQELYRAAHLRFAVRLRGVPLMVVGDITLVGSDEIPRRLPALVEGYLAKGGVGWPDIPGLAERVAASATPPSVPPRVPRKAAASPTPVTTALVAPVSTAAGLPQSPVHTPGPPISITSAPKGVAARVLADPHGNGLAVLVLAGMTACVSRSLVLLRRPAYATRAKALHRLCPLLALIGLGVAAYLARVEVRGIEAVCGPVGDCNTVQQSEYARLLGVLPIGVLGVAGFAAILVAWGAQRWTSGRPAAWGAITLLALTGLGTLFSMYLTFLEPFVIGATCLWCLSSAVIMTTLYGLALEPGRAAAAALRQRPRPARRRPS